MKNYVSKKRAIDNIEFSPSYLSLSDDEFYSRINNAYNMLDSCSLCPFECNVNRNHGQKGRCRSDSEIKVASINIHKGEEPPISIPYGSGTVFFSGCFLRCKFCQNYPISQFCNGNNLSVDELADGFIHLQDSGVQNINLVTPSHFTPQIIKAVFLAKQKGLRLPILWNSSGYEKVEAVKLLENIVDIYLPDYKYTDETIAVQFSNAPNYPVIALEAIKEMLRQTGDFTIDDSEIAIRGVLVRHLLIPGQLNNTKEVLNKLNLLTPRPHVSLLGQYFTAFEAINDKLLNRELEFEEYEKARQTFEDIGLEGYIQDLDLPGGC